MFQSLRQGLNLDFLDNKIAEEQEKQKRQQQPLPGKRATDRAAKGPDPDSFIISDEATATPAGGYRHVSFNGVVIEPANPPPPTPPKQDTENVTTTTTTTATTTRPPKGKEKAIEAETPSPPPAEVQLPPEVQQKLNKFEQLNSRYQNLLRNYRIAHAHVSAIEHFEAVLREYTPLTSISDPGAFVEFITQRNLQSDMVLDELKRVTAELRQHEVSAPAMPAVPSVDTPATPATPAVPSVDTPATPATPAVQSVDTPTTPAVSAVPSVDGASDAKKKKKKSKSKKKNKKAPTVGDLAQQERIEELEAERLVLQEAYERTCKDLATSESERSKISETCAEVTAKHDALRDQIRELQAESERTRKDLATSESERSKISETCAEVTAKHDALRDQIRELQAAYERTHKDLATSESERSKISETCAEVTAKHDALRDQIRELGTRIRERDQKSESFEEELADAHRLLSERSREGETMRRMLAEVEERANGKVKEMSQQLDHAIEERDRAEHEASTIGRRKAKEIDDLKNKLRDAEKEATAAFEAKEDAERKLSDFQIRLADLEKQASQAREEVTELRTAKGQLRKELDAAEADSIKLAQEKLVQRKKYQAVLDRIDKVEQQLVYTEQYNKRQIEKMTASFRPVPSPTYSDSPRVASPAPQQGTSVAQSSSVDPVYLKSVLLQFMEQKERKHRLQLVPVLSQLLHMSKEDEQKWYAAVQAKW